MHRQNCDAAEAPAQRRQNVAHALGAPDQCQPAAGGAAAVQRGLSSPSVEGPASCAARRPRSGDWLVPARIVERWIYQDAVGAVRRQAGARECVRLRVNIEHHGTTCDPVQRGVFLRQCDEPLIHIDKRQLDTLDAACQRKSRRAHARAEFDHPLSPTRVRRGCKQHCIMTRAMAPARLAQSQPTAEKGILGEVFGQGFPGQAFSVKILAESVIGPQLVGEAGIAEDLPRLAVIVLVDQNTARQHADRAFEHAHVLVQHQMVNMGAVEQRADRRNQHDIVGPNQFPQLWRSFADPLQGGPARVNRYLVFTCTPAALAAYAQQFLLL